MYVAVGLSLSGARVTLCSLAAVILSPVSLTEFPAYWCEHPDLFAAISQGANEQDRMERVLKWFIATLKGQYTVRHPRLEGGRIAHVSRPVTRRWAPRRR